MRSTEREHRSVPLLPMVRQTGIIIDHQKVDARSLRTSHLNVCYFMSETRMSVIYHEQRLLRKPKSALARRDMV